MKLSNLFKKHKKVRVGSLKKSIEIDPFLYWKNILFIMFGLLFLVSIAAVLIVYLVNNEKFVDSKSRAEVKDLVVVPFKDSELQKVIMLFEERGQERAKIILDKNIISDPSKNSTVSQDTNIAPVQNSTE